MSSSVLATRRDPNGAWEMVKAAPAAPLRGVVERYAGFVERSAVPLRRRETPTRRTVLVLNLGAPFTVAAPNAVLPGMRLSHKPPGVTHIHVRGALEH